MRADARRVRVLRLSPLAGGWRTAHSPRYAIDTDSTASSLARSPAQGVRRTDPAPPRNAIDGVELSPLASALRRAAIDGLELSPLAGAQRTLHSAPTQSTASS